VHVTKWSVVLCRFCVRWVQRSWRIKGSAVLWQCGSYCVYYDCFI